MAEVEVASSWLDVDIGAAFALPAAAAADNTKIIAARV